MPKTLLRFTSRGTTSNRKTRPPALGVSASQAYSIPYQHAATGLYAHILGWRRLSKPSDLKAREANGYNTREGSLWGLYPFVTSIGIGLAIKIVCSLALGPTRIRRVLQRLDLPHGGWEPELSLLHDTSDSWFSQKTDCVSVTNCCSIYRAQLVPSTIRLWIMKLTM